MSLEFANMLVLSTGHLTEECCNAYMPTRLSAYDKGGDGWFMHVPCASFDCEYHKTPQCLRDCFKFARKFNCEWIMFDTDGPHSEGLPYYEW